jgi:hypothetical protein
VAAVSLDPVHCVSSRQGIHHAALLEPVKYGTWIDMTNSYLGIISPRGLETLVLETEHAAMFLFRRLARRQFREATAFWAVLDGKAASDIAGHMRHGQFDEALRQLNSRALDWGTLLPPPEEDEVYCSTR